MVETVILETMCGCSRKYKIDKFQDEIKLNLLLKIEGKIINYVRVFKYNSTNESGIRIFTEVLMAN